MLPLSPLRVDQDRRRNPPEGEPSSNLRNEPLAECFTGASVDAATTSFVQFLGEDTVCLCSGEPLLSAMPRALQRNI
jgi:hypothetical protein